MPIVKNVKEILQSPHEKMLFANETFKRNLGSCACGKPGKFRAHGVLVFCGNRCLRQVNRNVGISSKHVLSADSKLLMEFRTRPVDGANIDRGIFKYDRHGKPVPLVLKDRAGKTIEELA